MFIGNLQRTYKEKIIEVPALLYQAPELEDKTTFILDMLDNSESMRKKTGTFDEKEDKYIKPRPDKFHQVHLIKGMVYCEKNEVVNPISPFGFYTANKKVKY